MRLTKVTEIRGYHSLDHESDCIVREHDDLGHALACILPDGSFRRRGRWKITVEFEPEET